MRSMQHAWILLAICSFIPAFEIPAHNITDATGLSSGEIQYTVTPESVEQLQRIIASSSGPIAICGAGYSQGGQTWANNAIVVDMSRLNRIIDVDVENKTVTVESGATWRHIQEAIGPKGLSPQVMQSYNDFTVGGTLSVNAHGRNITGSIITSVISVQVLLPSGSIVTASRSENYDLFQAVIGGYGSCGIIIQATLLLTDNVQMRRSVDTMHISEYVQYLRTHIINNHDIVLHNANLYPKSFERLRAINWVVDDDRGPVETAELIRPDAKHTIDTYGELLVRRLWGGKYLREKIEGALTSTPAYTHRNYEIGRPISTLGSWTQVISSNILQEYFIPLDYVETFIDNLRTIGKAYSVNILNASIRYVPADTESVLSYAPRDCCSIVLYINVVRTPQAFHNAQKWTQRLIDAAIACNGTYYLPYQLFASYEQFRLAYPGWKQLREIKRKYDPYNILSNQLIDTYVFVQNTEAWH